MDTWCMLHPGIPYSQAYKILPTSKALKVNPDALQTSQVDFDQCSTIWVRAEGEKNAMFDTMLSK